MAKPITFEIVACRGVVRLGGRSLVKQFEKKLPELDLSQSGFAKKPQIVFFEGKEDLKRAYLVPLTSKTEILNYCHPEKLEEYFRWDWIDEHYIRPRVEKKIPARILMPPNSYVERLLTNAVSTLRRIKVIPKTQFGPTNEILIYDNRVSLFSYEDDLAMIIESQSIADTQRALFELIWDRI